MTPLLLGSLFELKYGKSLRKDTRNEGGIPVFGSNGQVDVHSESLVNHPTIVVGRKGSIGEVHLVKTPCWPIDTTYFVSPRDEHEFDLDWLYRLLRTLRLQDLNRSAAIPGLNRDDVYRIQILLPPIEDQIRIAHLLGKVEGLIIQRKQHLQQLDDLLKSVFLEMFGPTSPGYETWPLVEIRELAAKHKGAMRTGPFGSNLLHSEFMSEGDVAVLGIDNAVQNRFAWGERRFISKEKYQELQSYRIFPGDVIVTIMGTIGRSAVIPDDISVAINTKHLAAITLNREVANPLFLSYAIHSSPYVLRQFASKNRGAIMSGLNLDLIKETKIKRAPIDLQDRFAEIHKSVDQLKSRYQQSIAYLESLYGALSQQAFKGELDLSRVPMPKPPTQHIGAISIGDQASVPEPVVQAVPVINLPTSDKLPAALENAEARKALIEEWLHAYNGQLRGTPFSAQDFMAAAQARLVELLPDTDLELRASDYEHIKTWVFEALAAGTLTQAFDDASNQIELKAIPA